MTSFQKYSIEGKDSEIVRLIVGVDILTTTVANTVPCASLTFNRAFTAAPYVIGVNSTRPSTIANAEASATQVTVWVRGLSDGLLADGTLQVAATLEGRLA